MKKAAPRTPHFLSLNQDIVAWSQKAKCALKYVIHSLGGHEKSGAEAPHGFWKMN